MSLSGNPTIFAIKPLATGSTMLHPLGTKGITADGRTYRYAEAAGTALTAGQLQVAADITTNHEGLAVNTAAVGDKTLSVTLGATLLAANEYDGGYVHVIASTGQGQTLLIKSAPATDASGTVVIQLVQPVATAFAAASTVTLQRNLYKNVVISNGTQTDIPVGVPNVNWAASAFGWLQTGGPCSILVDSNDTTVGTGVTIGAAVSGAVETRNAIAEPLVGVQPAGVGADAGEYGPFHLQLD